MSVERIRSDSCRDGVCGYAGLRVFYNCGGTFLNISRAEELEYPFPKQGFTVEQMFSINGADTIGVESSRITGLENIYQPLWDLFLQNSMYWNTLPDKRIALPDDRTYTFPLPEKAGKSRSGHSRLWHKRWCSSSISGISRLIRSMVRHGRSFFSPARHHGCCAVPGGAAVPLRWI